jgi:flavin-dependent dehydrogenase
MAQPREFDVCVVGAGPAGTATALRLAQLGKRVVVCEAQAFPRARVGESIPGSIATLLGVLGLDASIATTGTIPSRFSTVAWGGETTRFEIHGGPSQIVDRGAFDLALLRAATANVELSVHQPARVVRATHDGGRWSIDLEGGQTLAAAFLVEATGRDRLLPRCRKPLGVKTLAWYGYHDVGAENEGDTLVESGHDAWYWGAALPNGLFNATVFVDPGRRLDYSATVARSTLLSSRLRGARLVRGPTVCDATPYVDERPVTETSIKVGDAALSLDPLSSQGVYTALGTALHAAVTVNTLLERPQDAALAIDFYEHRVRSSGRFHARAASQFYAREAIHSRSAFWESRARFLSSFVPEDHLSPQAIVVPSPCLAYTPVPVVKDAHITTCDGLRLLDRTYAFVLDDVPIAPLLKQIETPLRALDVLQLWSRRLGPTKALDALHWAWSEGLLQRV